MEINKASWEVRDDGPLARMAAAKEEEMARF